MSKHILSTEEAIKKACVREDYDIVVVGGGPAGHSAAVAAARTGAKTVLIERYGHLGGMASGGLVTLIHSMSDGTNTQVIAGQAQEWLDRLDEWGAADHPKAEEIGSSDPAVLDRFKGFYFQPEGKLIHGARFDSEILKVVLNDMVAESDVKLYLHALMTDVVMDGKEVKGVVFESKSGRRAVFGKYIIDASGDGDVFARAGCAFTRADTAPNRIANPALCIEFANVDWNKNEAARAADPKGYESLMAELKELNGFTMHFRTTTVRNTVCHFNMFLEGYDVLDVEGLTRLEVDTRKRMMVTYKFFKEKIPGFEKCFIMITAPQVGIRGTRILDGRYTLTAGDAKAGVKFDDTIAEFPPLEGASPANPHVYVPFRTLLPKETERLIAVGRAFSSDFEVNEHFNTISHCIAMGQAAGTAAAMCVSSGSLLPAIDFAALRTKLVSAGALFPDFNK
jgi:hypothetical protein